MKSFKLTKYKKAEIIGPKNMWSNNCITFFSFALNIDWGCSGIPEFSTHLWVFGFQIFELVFFDERIK